MEKTLYTNEIGFNSFFKREAFIANVNQSSNFNIPFTVSTEYIHKQKDFDTLVAIDGKNDVSYFSNIFTVDELNWMINILSDYKRFEVSPSYFYKIKTENERNSNRENTRKQLDSIKDKLPKFTPQNLLELRNKNKRKNVGFDNFSGIYIIHNCDSDIYYVGKAKKIFDRAYRHFLKDEGNPKVYEDYKLGDKFSISLIPLEKTKFSTLNELEDNAIRAYDSFWNGYNRVQGNILDKHIFKNEEYQKVADLILDKIKGTELFLSLSNDRKRIKYTRRLFSELRLPDNAHFTINFVEMIKEYYNRN